MARVVEFEMTVMAHIQKERADAADVKEFKSKFEVTFEVRRNVIIMLHILYRSRKTRKQGSKPIWGLIRNEGCSKAQELGRSVPSRYKSVVVVLLYLFFNPVHWESHLSAVL